MRRRILCLVMAMVLLAVGALPVWAEDFDLSKTGSLSVTLTDPNQNEPMAGAALSLYCVAGIETRTDGRLLYTYTPDFSSLTIPPNDGGLTDALEVFVAENRVASVTQVTDAGGTAVWNDLALGLYFVKQTGTVAGFAPCASFLVTIPAETADGYVYEVNATPKTEVTKLTAITIRKVWNTDASTPPADSVTVHLLQKGQVVKIAVLNAQNDWQVTYTDMPVSDAYSIKEVDAPKGFTATYKQNGYVFTVTNTSTLIQTGQLVWPVPVLAGVGVLLLAMGVVLLQKKGKPNA